MALKLPSIGGMIDLVAPWWKALVGAAVVAGPVFLLGQCSGASTERDRAEAARLIAVTEALKVDGAAKEAAAGERLADATAVAEMKQELTNAIADLPDEITGANRVTFGCERLRRSGYDVASVPACSGPPVAAQAGPRP